MSRNIDSRNLDEDDLVWIFANYSNEVAKAKFGVSPQDVGWNPLDMSNVPPVPPASSLDSQGRRYTIPEVTPPKGELLPGPDSEPQDYSNMKRNELQAICHDRGLSSAGKNDDMVNRLVKWDEDNASVLPYEDWTDDELRDECKDRGIQFEGDRPALIDRLYGYDHAMEGAQQDEKKADAK